MTDIQVNSVEKSFEIGKKILDGLSFSITQGERVGILGRNGCGKTTLFRILTGEIEADEGEVVIASGKRIGLISQIPVYPEDTTAEDVLKSAHKRLFDIEDKLAELAERMETDQSPALLREYDRLQADYQRMGGYEAESERNRVANGLEITARMRAQDFESLSGGEKTRLNLARLILEDTEILLLDEPTNHLDLRATEWLEDYILHFKGTVLAVSHDRYFLDRVIGRCIEIVDGKAEFYSGNYSFFTEERQRRFEEKLRKYEKDQAKAEQLQRAAEQLHLWAFMGNDKLHKRAFSMEKRIEKLNTSEKPKEQKKLTVKFKEREFFGDEAVVTENLGKSYGEKRLFAGLDLTIRGGERVAVIGDNGTGKSTFVKILMDELKPDTGFMYRGPQVRAAYLPQSVSFGSESRSALDSMLYDCRCQPQEARDRLAAFGFRGESVMTPVGMMSGGERSRLKLCMLMGSDINLLILDEPTNHLDIASREWIEDALADYEQTLLFVSHDRFFIDRFATRILVFGEGTVKDFRGTYSQYKEWLARQEVYAKQETVREKKAAPKKAPSPDKGKTLQKLEREIEKLEGEIKALELQMEEYASDYVKLMELNESKDTLEVSLEELYERWEEAGA